MDEASLLSTLQNNNQYIHYHLTPIFSTCQSKICVLELDVNLRQTSRVCAHMYAHMHRQPLCLRGVKMSQCASEISLKSQRSGFVGTQIKTEINPKPYCVQHVLCNVYCSEGKLGNATVSS